MMTCKIAEPFHHKGDVDLKEGHLEGVTLMVVKESDSQKHVTLQNIPEIVWRVALHDSVWEATKKSRGTLLGMI